MTLINQAECNLPPFLLLLPHALISFALQQGEPCHLLAWTTTPWSLTANKAICFNPEAEYVIVRKASGSSEVGEAECYVVSKTLLSSSNDLKEIFGESPEVVFAGTGADMLSDATYKQVLANGVSQSLPVLPARYSQ